jgi:hypothetical protein
MEPAGPSELQSEYFAIPHRLPVGVAHPLPEGWPTPLLPLTHALERLNDVKKAEVAAAEIAEEEARISQVLPSEVASPSRKRKASICICKTEDEGKFMLACDDCNRWFHGACVGVSEKSAMSLGRWACKSCSKKAERLQNTCTCGVEDVNKFMLACDECDHWFHGDCVGVSEVKAMMSESMPWACRLCGLLRVVRAHVAHERTRMRAVWRAPFGACPFCILYDRPRPPSPSASPQTMRTGQEAGRATSPGVEVTLSALLRVPRVLGRQSLHDHVRWVQRVVSLGVCRPRSQFGGGQHSGSLPEVVLSSVPL